MAPSEPVADPRADRTLAVQAACDVAGAHGLAFTEPTSIGAASNVLVHLRPTPVVARVMTATAALHQNVRGWLEREVAVGKFLADRNAPIVPPSDLVAPGPHEHAGYWMTFWKFVQHDAGRGLGAPQELGRSLRELHARLADFPGSLPPLACVGDAIERLLNDLQPSSRLVEPELDAMSRELERLKPLVFETALPVQALHGDASLSNLLRTRSGLVWTDFEDVCAGPVEWDLSSLAVSLRHRGASAQFVNDVLRAYGGGVEELADFLSAHALYAEVWQAFQAQRVPFDG